MKVTQIYGKTGQPGMSVPPVLESGQHSHGESIRAGLGKEEFLSP
jgi:hypothetical protein